RRTSSGMLVGPGMARNSRPARTLMWTLSSAHGSRGRQVSTVAESGMSRRDRASSRPMRYGSSAVHATRSAGEQGVDVGLGGGRQGGQDGQDQPVELNGQGGDRQVAGEHAPMEAEDADRL